MASDTREHPRATRPLRRSAQAIVLGCCVLALASIPTATAKPDHTTGKPNHEHPSQGTPGAGGKGDAKGNPKEGNAKGNASAAPEEADVSHSQRAEGSEGKQGRGHNGGSKRHEHGSSTGGESAEEPAASHVSPGQARRPSRPKRPPSRLYRRLPLGAR